MTDQVLAQYTDHMQPQEKLPSKIHQQSSVNRTREPDFLSKVSQKLHPEPQSQRQSQQYLTAEGAEPGLELGQIDILDGDA